MCQILDNSIAVLLHTASIDAITRLSNANCEKTMKDLAFKIYFDAQQHFSLIEFISDALKNNRHMMQVLIIVFCILKFFSTDHNIWSIADTKLHH